MSNRKTVSLLKMTMVMMVASLTTTTYPAGASLNNGDSAADRRSAGRAHAITASADLERLFWDCYTSGAGKLGSALKTHFEGCMGDHFDPSHLHRAIELKTGRNEYRDNFKLSKTKPDESKSNSGASARKEISLQSAEVESAAIP